MPKLNFSAMQRQEPRVYPFDATENGQTLEVSLRELLPDEELLLPEEFEPLRRRYIDGDPENPDPALRGTVACQVGGRIIRMSKPLVWTALLLSKMQVLAPGEDGYSWLEWCECSVMMPNTFRALIVKVDSINEEAKKNVVGLTPGSISSLSPAAGTGNIPISPAGETTSSELSSNSSPASPAVSDAANVNTPA